MKGGYPGHAQYYRWLRGELTNKRKRRRAG
jgi:hypothetical protein